jgi:RNA polymerase sigma factor (sigma-70 family)
MEALEEAARLLPRQRQSINDDDAVQEGFLRMARRGTQGISNPGAYWHSAARRAQIESYRKARSERSAIARWLQVQRAQEPEHELPEEMLTLLKDSVEGLRGRRRQLVDLELGGLARIGDLAECLGISPGAVRVLRHRTYRQLRKAFTEGSALADLSVSQRRRGCLAGLSRIRRTTGRLRILRDQWPETYNFADTSEPFAV